MHTCESRRSRHQIMANTGFGEVTIIKSDSVVTIPQKGINQKTGKIKKAVNARLREQTLYGAEHLNKRYGITIVPGFKS